MPDKYIICEHCSLKYYKSNKARHENSKGCQNRKYNNNEKFVFSYNKTPSKPDDDDYYIMTMMNGEIRKTKTLF